MGLGEWECEEYPEPADKGGVVATAELNVISTSSKI